MKLFTITMLLLIYLSSAMETKKLNYPRVLLPVFEKISIEFTLEVTEGGCFKWTSSRNDLIQISPIYDDNDTDNECSYKATVIVLTKEKSRNTAIVLAEDSKTKDVLRCDVILDVIHKLDILTTTRELYLEEAPETFELMAEDSQGNVFTTLEGVEFDWKIISQNDNNKYNMKNDDDWRHVLRFLSFTESKYHEVPKALHKFELLGLKGYMVLLEGINTGTAKVSVRLPYSDYSHVPTIEVDIMVLANIILTPSDAYMMIDDTIEFKISQLKQGKLYEISLSDQYYFEIENEKIATVSGNIVKSKMIGRTSVLLRDRNVLVIISDNTNNVKLLTPKAELIVTTPEKIRINLLPNNNWITVEGEKHEIEINLYTRDNQKILLGPKYKLGSSFDETLFYVLKKNQNGSRIYGEAVKEGTNSVIGTFKQLTASAEMKIFKELIIIPKSIIIPFDPKQIKNDKIKFTAEGGDGHYQWSTLNSNFITISQNGIADIQIESIDSIILQKHKHKLLHKYTGDNYDNNMNDINNNNNDLITQANVKVSLKKNPKIYSMANIYILKPIKLEIVKYNFETSLHDYIYIHIGLYGYINNTMIPFTSCENLNFDISLTDPIFEIEINKDTYISDLIQYNKKTTTTTEKLATNACNLIKLHAINIGKSYFRISYTYMDVTLKADVLLNVFEKLKILDPITNEIILPIGATRNIIYVNGPQKLHEIDSDLIKNINYDKNIININEIYTDDITQEIIETQFLTNMKTIYSFTVLCKTIGETEFEFIVYNLLQSKNFTPYNMKFITKIYCVLPRIINLYLKHKLKDNCPLKLKKSLIQLNNDDDNQKIIEIEIEILDNKNRKLMNITSLTIDWEFENNNDYILDKNLCNRYTEKYINITISYKDILKCSISDIKNDFKIKAKVTKYNNFVLKYYNIEPEIPNFGIKKQMNDQLYQPIIKNEISFMAVNSTILPFQKFSVLLTDREARIPITQGSGYYNFEVSDQNIISIEFDEKTKELIIIPKCVGNVRIELFDRCLTTEPSQLIIYVVTIGMLQIDVIDRIQHFKSTELILKIYDSNDKLLKINHNILYVYDLHYEILNPSILNVRLLNHEDIKNEYEIRYIVTGIDIGDTKIIFHSGHGDNMVSSKPKNIQVFPQLRLYPRNVTIVIGSSLQIYYEGGPQPDANILFKIQNQNIVSIDSALVTAKKLGETKIIGKCYGNDPLTDKQILLSMDTIEIHVIQLENIILKAPLNRIKINSIMPVSIWGIPDLSPMVLGTLELSRIIWSTNHPDVINIYGIFSDIGIEYDNKDLISVRVNAINPGKAKIQATVVLSNCKRLSASIEVIVIKNLELESPKSIVMNSILMAPKSTMKLKANIDDVIYRLDHYSNATINITSDGYVKSTDVLGRNLIIANTFDQNLPIDITVKNIHYILARVKYSLIKLKQTENKIPKGLIIKLKISFHDNMGNEFSHNIESLNEIKYEVSQKDISDIHIGNNLTITMNIIHEMTNMVAISIKDHNGIKYAEDFIKVVSNESMHVFPSKTSFSVGDIICFDLPLIYTNYWTISDSKLVTIDQKTGLTRLLSISQKSIEKVTIMNGDKNGHHMKRDIDVHEVNEIQFVEQSGKMIDTEYYSHLIIRNHLEIDKSTNLFAKNASKCLSLMSDNIQDIKLFTCRLLTEDDIIQRILRYIRVTAVFDIKKGFYACKLELVKTLSDINTIIKRTDIIIVVEAQLPNGNSDTINIQIFPGIKIYPVSLDEMIQKGIRIDGLDRSLKAIQIESSDPKKMSVTLSKQKPGISLYAIKFLECISKDDELVIKINSPTTSQYIEIPIDWSMIVQDCTKESMFQLPKFIYDVSLFIINIFSVLFVLFIAVVVYMMGRNTARESESNVFMSRSNDDHSYDENINLPQHEPSHLLQACSSELYALGASSSSSSFISGNSSLNFDPSQSLSTFRRGYETQPKQQASRLRTANISMRQRKQN